MNKIKIENFKLSYTLLNIILIILLFKIINSEKNLRSLKEETLSKEYINLVNCKK